jgi:hypothetical protein
MVPAQSTEMPMDRADVDAKSAGDFGVAGRITAVAKDRDRDATLTRREDPLEPPPEEVELARRCENVLPTDTTHTGRHPVRRQVADEAINADR